MTLPWFQLKRAKQSKWLIWKEMNNLRFWIQRRNQNWRRIKKMKMDIQCAILWSLWLGVLLLLPSAFWLGSRIMRAETRRCKSCWADRGTWREARFGRLMLIALEEDGIRSHLTINRLVMKRIQQIRFTKPITRAFKRIQMASSSKSSALLPNQLPVKRYTFTSCHTLTLI